MRPTIPILIPVLAGLLSACQSTKEPEVVGPVSLSFDWGQTGACFEPSSPAFTVGNVPQGTVKLGFRMLDLDAPSFNHGGGVVAYGGQTAILAGAFRYKGPCPQLKAHTYRWTVDAVDADGNVLAKGQADQPFGPSGPSGVSPAPAVAPGPVN